MAWQFNGHFAGHYWLKLPINGKKNQVVFTWGARHPAALPVLDHH